MSRTTRLSKYQKGKTRKVKTNLDLLEQETVSSSGICWDICNSAAHPRQPRQHPTTQFFTGKMPFLPPNQQRQSISLLFSYSALGCKSVIINQSKIMVSWVHASLAPNSISTGSVVFAGLTSVTNTDRQTDRQSTPRQDMHLSMVAAVQAMRPNN